MEGEQVCKETRKDGRQSWRQEQSADRERLKSMDCILQQQGLVKSPVSHVASDSDWEVRLGPEEPSAQQGSQSGGHQDSHQVRSKEAVGVEKKKQIQGILGSGIKRS